MADYTNLIIVLFSGLFGAALAVLSFKYQIRDIKREFIELSYDVETVVKTVKRRNARDAMQVKRDSEEEDDELVQRAKESLAQMGGQTVIDLDPKAALRKTANH